MPKTDPYHPEKPFEYECAECGRRIRADENPGECEDCGGPMQDVSVPRE